MVVGKNLQKIISKEQDNHKGTYYLRRGEFHSASNGQHPMINLPGFRRVYLVVGSSE